MTQAGGFYPLSVRSLYAKRVMPIYEFHCNSCGRRVSLFQRNMNAQTAPVCPHCQSNDLKRLISTFSVVRSNTDPIGSDDFGDADFEGLGAGDTDEMLDSAHRLGQNMGVDLGSDFDGDMNSMLSGDLGGGDDFGE